MPLVPKSKMFLLLSLALPFALAPGLAHGVPMDPSGAACLQMGLKAEKDGALSKALAFYSEALKKDVQLQPARDGLRRAERKIRQRLRLDDSEYRKLILTLRPSQALDLYQHVAGVLGATFVDGEKAQPGELYRHALDELACLLRLGSALEPVLGKIDPVSQETLLAKILEFRQRPLKELGEIREALLNLASEIRDSGWATLGNRAATLAILECAQGACHGLDEFTLLLSPAGRNELDLELQGKQGGVGLSLSLTQGRYEVTRVQVGSPAEEAGLAPGDFVLSLNTQAAGMLTPARMRGLLVGEPGSELALQVLFQGMNMTTGIKLKRKLLPDMSVDWEVLPGMAGEILGLVRVSSFHETTPQEIKEALASLQMDGVNGLILDLRGNPGGHFRAALNSAEIFLPSGAVALGESQSPEFNRPFTVSSRNPVSLPMVILVDEDTASAAEVLALGLQYHGRARVAGSKTRGKNSIQCLIPLDKSPWDKHPGGVQVTVARLLSPGGQGFERGITPDVRVEGDVATVLAAGKMELLRLLGKQPGKSLPMEMK
ncbi:MAG: PDZ domain-containing protein [Gemmataceae bacterium]|nr:PDZ domain-containing protein [Gemmataceae bacterium]